MNSRQYTENQTRIMSGCTSSCTQQTSGNFMCETCSCWKYYSFLLFYYSWKYSVIWVRGGAWVVACSRQDMMQKVCSGHPTVYSTLKKICKMISVSGRTARSLQTPHVLHSCSLKWLSSLSDICIFVIMCQSRNIHVIN